jgi:hypothetical protein
MRPEQPLRSLNAMVRLQLPSPAVSGRRPDYRSFDRLEGASATARDFWDGTSALGIKPGATRCSPFHETVT